MFGYPEIVREASSRAPGSAELQGPWEEDLRKVGHRKREGWGHEKWGIGERGESGENRSQKQLAERKEGVDHFKHRRK